MRLYISHTKAISFVPKGVWIFLLLSFFLQCWWHVSFTRFEVKRYDLEKPPSYLSVRLSSLDDPLFASKVLMLWLQAFDNQPGVSIPLKELNYDSVIEWLDLILELDNKIQYPLLAAIRFYAEVSDEEKQRKMIQYVSNKFIEKPNERWSFMAHAVYIAKHRIKDEQLALKCARLIRQYAKGDEVPYWAKQMEIFVLENMGELESAMVLIGGLLESGELKDEHQIKFLKERLRDLEERQTSSID